MHITLSVRVTIKDRPKDWRGVTSASFTVGQLRKTDLREAMMAMAEVLTGFYIDVYGEERVIADLHAAGKYLLEAGLPVEEAETDGD